MKYKLHARQLQQSYEMLGYFSVDDKLFLISIKLKYIVILRNNKLKELLLPQNKINWYKWVQTNKEIKTFLQCELIWHTFNDSVMKQWTFTVFKIQVYLNIWSVPIKLFCTRLFVGRQSLSTQTNSNSRLENTSLKTKQCLT